MQKELVELNELEKVQEETEENKKPQETSVTQLRNLILSQNIELSYNDENRAFIKLRINNHYEVYPLDSMQFHDYVYELYDTQEDAVLNKATYEAVVESLGARARIRGSKQLIALRTAKFNDTIYLSLCDDNWTIIEIDKDGWRVSLDSPVWFFRTNDMDALPMPTMTKTRDIELLKKYVNYGSEADFSLMVSFLLSSFMYQVSRPILILQGTAGVGKSFTSEILRTIVDPAKQKKSISRARPTVDSLALDVSRQSVVVYDNFSDGAVTPEVSDMFCTIATNQAYSKRALYTNSDEILVKLGRAVIINGIDDLAKRHDLLDRSIVLDLPPLVTRQSEVSLRENFKKDHPKILGHLLNVLSDSLKHEGESDYSDSRMTDFTRMVENAHRSLNWDKHYFRHVYKENRDKASLKTIESNPFISSIVELMEGYDKRRFKKTDLLTEIGKLDSVAWKDMGNGVIPSNRKVSARLKRDVPLLKTVGISYKEIETNGLNVVEFYKK